MKTILCICVVMGALAYFLTLGAGCAHGPPKPSPCIGSAEARKTMPCWCPGTLDPACEPWITDAKKPSKEPTR